MKRLGLIGPGKVGRSIVQALPRDRYRLGPVRGEGPSAARRLVRDLHDGRLVTSAGPFADCDAILIATPETALATVIGELIEADIDWKRKCVLHTGREGSPEFARLTDLGAAVAGCYPLQAFNRAKGSLAGVHFVLAGDAVAVRFGRALVRAVGGQSHVVSRQLQVQASVASSLASDVVAGVLEISLRRLMSAGISRRRAVEAMKPIVMATLDGRRRAGGRNSRISELDGPLMARMAAACEEDDSSDGRLYRSALELAKESLEAGDADS